MHAQLEHHCDLHSREECPDVVVIRFHNGDIGIPIRDGGGSILKINYCPWCGRQLKK